MGDNEESTNSDKVLIVPLSEDSKKITQILSNEKAMKMLDILADNPMSASDVAEKLDIPLTTVKYNLDGLVEADLIKVKETKWSKKGRQIKIYEPVQKFIVVAPGSTKDDRSSIIGMLKKYLGLVAGAVFAATGLEALTRSLGGKSAISNDAATAPLFAEDEAMEAMSKEAALEDTAEETMEGADVLEKATETDAGDVAEADLTSDEILTEEVIPEESAEAVEEWPEMESDEMTGTITDEEIVDEALMEEEEFLQTDTAEYEMPEEAAVSDGMSGVDDVSPEMLESSTFDGAEAGADMVREGMNAATGNQTQSMSQTLTDNMSPMPEPMGGMFPDGILSHVSVWFFFGCLFVITLLFVREMYYRKKNI